jgi:hypothetical protein
MSTEAGVREEAPRFLPIMLLVLAGVFTLGCLVGDMTHRDHSPVPITWAPGRNTDYTEAELRQPHLTAVTEPMDIIVHIVADIHASCGADAGACSKAYNVAPRLGRPCEVWVPAGQPMDLDPGNEHARWLNDWDAGVWPHELAHCMHQNWHEPFTAWYLDLKRGLGEEEK